MKRISLVGFGIILQRSIGLVMERAKIDCVDAGKSILGGYLLQHPFQKTLLGGGLSLGRALGSYFFLGRLFVQDCFLRRLLFLNDWMSAAGDESAENAKRKNEGKEYP